MNKFFVRFVACMLVMANALVPAAASGFSSGLSTSDASPATPKSSAFHALFEEQALNTASAFILKLKSLLVAGKYTSRAHRLDPVLHASMHDSHPMFSVWGDARPSPGLQVHWAAVSHDPSNQWKPYSQSYTLTHGATSMSGEIFWMLDHVYIRIGSRWVRFPSTTYPVAQAQQVHKGDPLPWEDLLSGPLLLGNPAVRTFMGIAIAIEPIVRGLPDGAELMVEKNGFMASHYDVSQIAEAENVLAQINPFARYRDHDLSAADLAAFLDAYILISGAGAGHEQIYDRARQQLNFMIGAVQDSGVPALHGISIEQLQLIRVLGEKRKLGFNVITVDLVKKLKNVVAESVTANGKVFILGKDGRVVRADAINQGNLVPTSNAPHIHDLQQAARDGHYSRFVVPFLMYGGNATRIRDTVFANKVTGFLFWMGQESADVLRRLLREHGFEAMAERVQSAYGFYQVSMLHLLSLLMPSGIYLAGPSSLVAGAEMVGAEHQLIQNMAHQIDAEGAVMPLTSDLAGHGDAYKELMASMPAIQKAIRKGGVIVLSNAEYYDPAMFDVVAMQVVKGKNVAAITVFPQAVKFAAPGFEFLADAFRTGKALRVNLGDGLKTLTNVNVKDGSIAFEDGTHFSFYNALDNADSVWTKLHARLETANAITDPTAQRDQIIDILNEFEETIENPLSGLVMTVAMADGSEKKVPAFRIDVIDGGMLSEVQGVVSFVEKTQLGATHPLRKSSGETYQVNRKTLEAVWWKDFNPQFFGWDSFAMKACLTQEAQSLYLEFRRSLAAAASDEEKIALREKYAQLIYDANPELTPERWSQLVEMFDLLQSVLMVPPFEAKAKARGDRYFKINKMAQQVMTFMVALSMSNVNMEDIDLEVLRGAVERLQNASNEEERMAIRNSLMFGHGKTINDLAQVEVPKGPAAAGLIRVETHQFVQVKKPEDTEPFAEAINRFFANVVPQGLLIRSTMGSLAWIATGNVAQELLALGILNESLARTLGWAAWHEDLHTHFIHGSSRNVLFSRHPWEEPLLKEFRELVVTGLAKDVWTGWLAFANKWKDAFPPVAGPGDDAGTDFGNGEHPIYMFDSQFSVLPKRAA